MKKWQVLLLVSLALVLLVSAPIAALANDEGQTAPAAGAPTGALAVVAPWSGWVGQELSMAVFVRHNQEPLPGAGIWAITKEKAEALKQELSASGQAGPALADKDTESVVAAYGIFLGRTGGNGKLTYTFEQAGKYVLVAAKNGYVPGHTVIGIKEPIKALGIQAPRRIAVGQQTTMTVFERITQNPVEAAGVWAVAKDKVEALKEAAQELKEDTATSASEKDYEEVVKLYGVFLGRTDKHGKLDFAIDEANSYLLVAVKRGYIPGLAPLLVHSVPKALGIKVTPPQTHVGKEVTVNVFDKQNNDPVEGAGVWAVSRENVEALRQEIAALQEDKSTPAQDKDYDTVIGAHGTFLGKTDAKGRLEATFNEAGGYLLIAAKKGYLPGFTTLRVSDLPNSTLAIPQAQ